MQNNENKELVTQVIQDLIWEFEQKVEGYVASKQFPTCTDAVSFRILDKNQIFVLDTDFVPGTVGLFMSTEVGTCFRESNQAVG